MVNARLLRCCGARAGLCVRSALAGRAAGNVRCKHTPTAFLICCLLLSSLLSPPALCRSVPATLRSCFQIVFPLSVFSRLCAGAVQQRGGRTNANSTCHLLRPCSMKRGESTDEPTRHVYVHNYESLRFCVCFGIFFTSLLTSSSGRPTPRGFRVDSWGAAFRLVCSERCV